MPAVLEKKSGWAAPAPGPTSIAVIGADQEERAKLESALARLGGVALETRDGDADVYVAPCDLRQEGVLEQVRERVKALPGRLVLVLAGGATGRELKAALRAGAAGLVREQDAGATLAATVIAVGGGQLSIPIELAHQVEKPVLSRRQKQVIGLVVLGLSNGEIAAKLHLSEHTVKCHLYASFRKLGVNSRDEAVALILDPDAGLGPGILAISPEQSKPAAATPTG
jgi:DNA-binding NarL/FixJ family response regulator